MSSLNTHRWHNSVFQELFPLDFTIFSEYHTWAHVAGITQYLVFQELFPLDFIIFSEYHL